MSKVLIISNNSFSKTSNNGKTYEAIFSKFEKENISQIFFSENEEPDLNYCDKYFKITDKDVLLNLITFSNKYGKKLNNVEVASQANSENVLFNSKSSRLFQIFQKKADALVLFRDVLWKFNTWKTPQLKNWLKEIDPDVIFFVGGPMKFPYEIVKWICTFIDKPFAVYFTDDYILYPVSRNILDRIVKQRARKFYKEMISLSSARFTIGEVMSQEYKNYFGRDFYSIMNSVEVNDNKIDINYSGKIKPNISYFGGLHLNRWQMISKLGSLFKNDFTINVYSIYQPEEEVLSSFKKNGIQFCGGVIDEELKRKIHESDILLHVESDDIYNRNLTKLSVSTKIPEYLIAGKLVLGFGPSDIASMRVLSDNNIGIVISSDCDNNEIVKYITLIKNVEIRNGFAQRGLSYAKNHFDMNKNAQTFKKIIENL